MKLYYLTILETTPAPTVRPPSLIANLNVSGALRFVGWIVLLCVLIFFFSRTYSGKKFFQFLRLSRMEIRKVVYPKRQEVVRNTALIIFLVLSISVIMWLADLFFIWAIGFFTLG